MVGDIIMSRKEISRLEAMVWLKEKNKSQKEVAALLKLSIRQTKRLWQRYRMYGPKGLISKHRGRPSNNMLPKELRGNVLFLIKNKYVDFGPTFLQEKLCEVEKIEVSRETLRKMMIVEGIWKGRKRKLAPIHQSRERRASLGELVQIDGSPHDWFEGRADKCCLLAYIDDAAGKIQQLHFEPTETTEGYFKATRSYIKKHGIPLAFYSDRNAIFRVNRPEVFLENDTQFGRAMKQLGVELICANSPQAKGRVERLNKTLQDRLIKELRLRGISDIKTANEYLPVFIEDYNRRFAVVPRSETNVHKKVALAEEALDLIFSFQDERKLSKNLEISYKNTIYQIKVFGKGYTLRHANVLISEGLDGAISIIYKGRKLKYQILKKQRHAAEVLCSKNLNARVDELLRLVHKTSTEQVFKKQSAQYASGVAG